MRKPTEEIECDEKGTSLEEDSTFEQWCYNKSVHPTQNSSDLKNQRHGRKLIKNAFNMENHIWEGYDEEEKAETSKYSIK